MKKVLIGLVVAVAAFYALAWSVPFDPEERRPGLKLGGNMATDQATDWSFLEGRNQIYVQMTAWYGLPHSITTTSWVYDGELYVPCGRCESKIWPRYVESNNSVVLQVNGERYERRAERITDAGERREVMGIGHGHDARPDVWVYRMAPR